jgi:hypothetical protein
MAWQQFEVSGPLELDLPITRRVPSRAEQFPSGYIVA